MESFTHQKPIIACNISSESLQKYKEKMSSLPQDDSWGPLMPLCQYKGFWFTTFILEGAMHAEDHFQAQPSDVFLCSPMKAGSTWLKALSFAIATRNHFDNSNNPLQFTSPQDCIPALEFGERFTATGPRIPLFASHLPYTLLPKSVTDLGCKIVYLYRDPKDIFVSLWHFFQDTMESNFPGKGEMNIVSMAEAFDLFCKGLSLYGPHWEHVLGYWKASLEFPDRILFLKYEDMKKDTKNCVKKLAEFYECPFSTDEETEGVVERVIEFCSFETLRNLEVNKSGKLMKRGTLAENSSFFRKGKVGDWRNYLSEEMAMRLDNIMHEKLNGYGFAFCA